MRGKNVFFAIVAGLTVTQCLSSAALGNLFDNPGPFISPQIQNSIPNPAKIPGKEFSDYLDRDQNGAPDPHQILGWDGVNPNYGVGDADDFTSNLGSLSTTQIDAIANRGDALFTALTSDLVPLVFSTVGSGNIDYELAGSGNMGHWVAANQVDVTNPPSDLDGLELWGPPLTRNAGDLVNPLFADTNRFSLDGDPGLPGGPRISVFNDDGTDYILQQAIADAVVSLMPDLDNFRELIDLDALMVRDLAGSTDDGEFSPDDQIIFSIEKIDTSSLLATGQELFVLQGDGTASFLSHGGHLWDYNWAAQNPIGDINAIEAVPGPTTLVLAVISLLGGMYRRRRRA